MFARPRPKKDLLQPPPKKRKTTHTIEEITFDKDARTDYLTGFRKRKQARIKEAQTIAAKKEREERIRIRKQVREERKQALEEHVKTVQQILREATETTGPAAGHGGSSDNEEWGGLSDDDVQEAPIDMEDEYIDEDRYTTVTVEAVNVDRDGLHRPGEEAEREAEKEALTKSKMEAEEKANAEKKKKEWPKKKKKVFRYEDRHDRKVAERKQRAKKGGKR